jgi:hypothetical protein
MHIRSAFVCARGWLGERLADHRHGSQIYTPLCRNRGPLAGSINSAGCHCPTIMTLALSKQMLRRRQKPGSPAGLVAPHRRCFLPRQSYPIGGAERGRAGGRARSGPDICRGRRDRIGRKVVTNETSAVPRPRARRCPVPAAVHRTRVQPGRWHTIVSIYTTDYLQ